MDAAIQRELNDKLYEKRKVGALNLERYVRDACANQDHEKIQKIIYQLCNDYAYAVHQPHARNGGLIGLAAAAIALGPEVARYLQEIVPPVLACFTDHDARVRYYACESMYNISKVAKGEILVFFNELFDALCKLAADSELSVKNGAELLDRLIKDIVSESAANYVSVLQSPEEVIADADDEDDDEYDDYPTAFSLARFIPLLTERIHVINPFTRTFLVSWITLLDSIPDLELVFYLPAFLGGLFKFLGDPNQDVQVATQGCLERFLAEIKQIASIKKEIEQNRKSQGDEELRQSVSTQDTLGEEKKEVKERETDIGDGSETLSDGDGQSTESDWIPGQDVYVDHPKILEILVTFLDTTAGIDTTATELSHVNTNYRHSEEDIQLTALRWIDSFFEICPEDILPFVPRLLSQVLPAMASDVDQVRQAAHRVNNSLLQYIVSLSEESNRDEPATSASARLSISTSKDGATSDQREPNTTGKPGPSGSRDVDSKKSTDAETPSLQNVSATTSEPKPDLDYAAAIKALTLQFRNEHETTRAGALNWLIMLHRKAPRKMLAINDETFPALMKTLSDPAEAVVTRDLQLLSQISKNSEDSYFTSFMVNLLQLFCTDRRLLETRGNLIIRQLCLSLSAERIYRTLADCLEKDEDMEFASIMVQNLNNNLITAPELADLRKRLKNLETKDGQTFFVALFRSWCHNAVATFSLCLLAQAYEQAYNLLQIFAELEMTIQMLIQIDKLVQLLESPVFTYLRLQLLEPEKYPHLYKCLYGLLMLLPQSSAFAALKNRLNSVSAIGYLHIAPRPTPSTPASAYERPNRLKGREEGGVRWGELLEKFKSVQEKAHRQRQRDAKQTASRLGGGDFVNESSDFLDADNEKASLRTTAGGGGGGATINNTRLNPGGPGSSRYSISGRTGIDSTTHATGNVASSTPATNTTNPAPSVAQGGGHHKSKSSLSSNFGRLSGAVGGRKAKR